MPIDESETAPAPDTEISLLGEIARLRRLLEALEHDGLVDNSGQIATVSTALARLVYVHATRAKDTGELETMLQQAGAAALDEIRLAQL